MIIATLFCEHESKVKEVLKRSSDSIDALPHVPKAHLWMFLYPWWTISAIPWTASHFQCLLLYTSLLEGILYAYKIAQLQARTTQKGQRVNAALGTVFSRELQLSTYPACSLLSILLTFLSASLAGKKCNLSSDKWMCIHIYVCVYMCVFTYLYA